MSLIARFGTLCSRRYNVILKRFPIFPEQQIYYSMLIHKPVKISCLHSRIMQQLQYRFQSNSGESKEKIKDSDTAETSTGNKLSQRARLKQAVAAYGTTIIVFHVTISLASLGVCYLALSNGVDVINLLQRIGFPDYVIHSNVAVGGSTFVMAYAIHKLFAPARIAVTLSAAPFIVRYLRKINFIKPPK